MSGFGKFWMGDGRGASSDARKAALHQWGLVAALGMVVFFAYFVYPSTNRGSLVRWLIHAWSHDPDYSHGFLVPFISVALVIYTWRRLPKMEADSPILGMAVLVAAVVLYWVGIRIQRPQVTALSFMALVTGLSLYIGGWRVTKAMAFPIAFLIFMIPMSFFLQPLTFQLRMIVTVVSTFLLNVMGIQAARSGTAIDINPGTPGYALEVADPCSGIRSLVMLAALASLYGYLALDKTWKKWLLFAAAPPLAVAANIVRIMTISMIARAFDLGIALRVYHDWSGFIVFGVAVISLLGASLLLNTDYRRLVQYWASEPVPPRKKP